MATSEFSTEDFELVFTKGQDFLKQASPIYSVTGAKFYSEIPLAADITLLVVVVGFGLIFNATILRCYWAVRTDIGTYTKGFAVFDIFILIYLVFMWMARYFMATNLFLNLQLLNGLNMIACNIMIGPLFLGLDRGLIVAFPHKFKIYKARMRFFKGVWLLVSVLAGIGTCFTSEIRNISFVFSILNLYLQLLACVGLYAFIAVRILISERKMKNHRQIGNM